MYASKLANLDILESSIHNVFADLPEEFLWHTVKDVAERLRKTRTNVSKSHVLKVLSSPEEEEEEEEEQRGALLEPAFAT